MKKTDTTPGTPTSSAMTRRKFVETTAVAGGALVAAPFLGGKAPAYAQARKVHYLQWTSFVPAADAEIDRQAEEFTKATGIEMTVEKINQNDMAARITAAVESGSGADVIQMNANQPQLFANGLADHNALVEELGGDELYDGRAAPPRWTASPGACRCSTSPMPSSTARTCSRSWALPCPTPGTSISRSAGPSRTTTCRSARRSATPSAMPRRSPTR